MVMIDINNNSIVMQVKKLFSRYTFGGEVIRLMALAVLVKPLGLLTQILMAKYYGTCVEYDAYVLALFLVTSVEITVGRVFTAVYLPLIIKLKSKLDSNQLEQFKNALLFIFVLPGIVYTVFLLFSSTFPVRVVARNAPDETINYAVSMIRFMALPGLLMLLVAMGKTVLNANRHFRIPALMPAARSALFVVCLYFLHEKQGIWALPISFAISSTSQLVIIWITSLLKKSIVFSTPSLPSGAKKQIWTLSRFIFFSTAFMTLNDFLDKMFASGLEAGSVSTIAYSFVIISFSVQTIQLSLNTVMFTRMSEFIAEDKFEQCSNYLIQNFNKLTRLVLPFALSLLISSTEIVRVLFQRGEFDSESAARTVATLSIYMIGLPALILNLPVTRIFHALQRMRDKVWLAFQFLATNAIGNMLLIGMYKVAGLAMSSSIAVTLHLFLSLIVLSRYKTGLAIGRLSVIIIRSYIFAFLTWLVFRFCGYSLYVGNIFSGETVVGAIQIAVAKTVFVFVVFLLMSFLWSKRPGKKGGLDRNV
jgi:putative peptidoglycan lipid II flippase